MHVFSFFVDGTDPRWIEIEYHSRFQIPGFQILGLPGPEIQEARERIIAAFQNSDFEFPKRKIIVNLTPSSMKKTGTGHDLGIAIKILSAHTDHPFPPALLAWGELGLDGSIKSTGKMAHLTELLLSQKSDSTLALYLAQDDALQFENLISWRKIVKLKTPHLSVRALNHLRELVEVKKS